MSLPSASFHSCIYLDASARQAASAVSSSFRQLLRRKGSRPLHSARACEKLFGDNAVLCLSARTAFDALLTTRNFPKGSHVIMSGESPPETVFPLFNCLLLHISPAINIPDMVTIVQAHGLLPVPIDLDFDTLSPDVAQFKAAVDDERSVCAVVAHVFGCIVDMTPYVELCRRKPGFLLVEDAAEAFCPELMRIPVLCSVRLYSFGPIKVCTSWTGAVAVVRDGEQCAALRRQLSSYPLQTRWSHLLRVLKFFFLVHPYP